MHGNGEKYLCRTIYDLNMNLKKTLSISMGAILCAWGIVIIWNLSQILINVFKVHTYIHTLDDHASITLGEARRLIGNVYSAAHASQRLSYAIYPLKIFPLFKEDITLLKDASSLAEDSSQVLLETLSLIQSARSDGQSSMPLMDLLDGENWQFPHPRVVERWATVVNNFMTASASHERTLRTLLSDVRVCEIIRRDNCNKLLSVLDTTEARIVFERYGEVWNQFYSDVIAVYPLLTGFERPTDILFVIQNNNELRATGGFFGTYGRLIIDRGRVGSFSTDNIYARDYPARDKVTRESPRPIARYLKEPLWFMRDGNWYPDWAKSAALISEMWRDQTGQRSPFTAVIAITPELITNILSLTGPVKVGEVEFTSQTLMDVLEIRVGKDFEKLGFNIFNRKEIIDELKVALLQAIRDKAFEFLPLLPSIIKEAKDSQSIMAWSFDKRLQDKFVKWEIDGTILNTVPYEWIHISDSNLGSLKSDPAIERKASIEKKDQRIRSLTLTYSHTKSFDWRTTRYRTWTRIYLPQGTKLLQSDSWMIMDRNPHRTQPEVYEESNATVIAGFLSIEPLTTETIRLTYLLPENISTESIRIMRQPGSVREWTFSTPTNSVRKIISRHYTYLWPTFE
jgi:hypothetical protein